MTGLVDTETRRIIEECYGQVLATLQSSRDRLARTLLDRETHTSPRRTAGGRPSRPGLHHAYRLR